MDTVVAKSMQNVKIFNIINIGAIVVITPYRNAPQPNELSPAAVRST
jgi:hypothetical protein